MKNSLGRPYICLIPRYTFSFWISDVWRRISLNFSRERKVKAAATAIICVETISRFVRTLGIGEKEEAERPRFEDQAGRTHPIFNKRPVPGGRIELALTHRPFARELWANWVNLCMTSIATLPERTS